VDGAHQVTVWRDVAGKRIVVAFRGTEQARWRDFMTDALIVQQPFTPGIEPWSSPIFLRTHTAAKDVTRGHRSGPFSTVRTIQPYF